MVRWPQSRPSIIAILSLALALDFILELPSKQETLFGFGPGFHAWAPFKAKGPLRHYEALDFTLGLSSSRGLRGPYNALENLRRPSGMEEKNREVKQSRTEWNATEQNATTQKEGN